MTTPTDRAAVHPRLGRRALVCAALAALVFASRAWLAHAYGSAVPFWDEWDVEAEKLYRPWLAGTLHFIDLLKAHNEHRLFLTRVADLGFFVFFGRWEPWAQIVLNALLHAATAAGLAAAFWPALPARTRTPLILGIAAIFTATCGWQNALLGIQTQVYFSSLLAVAALAGLTRARPWSSGWWAGWLAAAVALLSFGGGLLAALAACITLGVTAFFPRPDRTAKTSWPALALIAAVAVTGLLLFVEPDRQTGLHAHGVAQFYAVFARCLGWPHVDSPVLWLVMQAPLVVLIVARWRRGESLDATERLALGLVIFAVLQAAAVARNRGASLLDARPLSRYQDPLLLGAAAQWFVALRLAANYARNGRLLAIVWAAAAAFGLLTLTTTNLSLNLPYKRAQDAASLTQIRSYLAAHDASVFTRDPLFPGPHPNPQVVERVLDDPLLRPVLPAIFFSEQPESASGAKPWLIEHGALFTLMAFVALLAALAWPTSFAFVRRRPISE
jgi:hypothetical protein